MYMAVGLPILWLGPIFGTCSKDTFRQHRQKFSAPPQVKASSFYAFPFQILFQSVLL